MRNSLRRSFFTIVMTLAAVAPGCVPGLMAGEYSNNATGETVSGRLGALQEAVLMGDSVAVVVTLPGCVRRFQCAEYAVLPDVVCCAMPLNMTNLNCHSLQYNHVDGVMQWCTNGVERAAVGPRVFNARFDMLWVW